jgi:hypothetical protein
MSHKMHRGITAEVVRDKVTELTGGVTEGVKADGQATDIVKSNDS